MTWTSPLIEKIIKDISTISNSVKNSANVIATSQKRGVSQVSVKFIDNKENSAITNNFPTMNIRPNGLLSTCSHCFEATYITREPFPSSHINVANSCNKEDH